MSDLLAELLKIVAVVATPVLLYFVQRGIAAFERRTNVHLTTEQRAVVLGAADTVKGVILTKLATGQLRLDQVDPKGRAVLEITKEVLGAVSTAATALGTTDADLARKAVALVGDKLADDPTVPTVSQPLATASKSS